MRKLDQKFIDKIIMNSMKKNPEKQNALLKLTIPQGLKDDFKILCQIKDCTMTHAVIQLLENACVQRSEDITEIKQRRHRQS